MAIPYTRGTTNTGKALSFLKSQMFTSNKGDRSNVDNVAVVITDGGSNDKNKTLIEAHKVNISPGLSPIGRNPDDAPNVILQERRNKMIAD